MALREVLRRERVLAAAVDVADAEGLAALTMRRLAGALGVEAMSLYHHVANKDALLDGVVEVVLTEILDHVERAGCDLDDPADWRARLRCRFLAARRVIVRHPWVPELLSSRPGIPPVVYPYFDQILGVMIEGGLSYQLGHRALHAFGSMSLGFVQELFTPDADADDGSVIEHEKLAAMASALPHITTMVQSEIHAAESDAVSWCDSQAEFEFTLDLLLDGLERARHMEHAS